MEGYNNASLFSSMNSQIVEQIKEPELEEKPQYIEKSNVHATKNITADTAVNHHIIPENPPKKSSIFDYQNDYYIILSLILIIIGLYFYYEG